MLGLFILLFVLSLSPILVDYIITKQHEETEYFQQTHRSLKEIKSDKGLYGEFKIYKALSKLEGYKKFLFNCYVYKDNGDLTEIDILFLHSSGLYVIESKNYGGWIFGTESHTNWTQTFPIGKGRSKKIKFFNPIIQNKVHLKWLEYYLSDSTPLLHSLIVFSDECTLKEINLTSFHHYVIQQKNLWSTIQYINKGVGPQLSVTQIDRLYNSLRPLTQRNQKIKTQHIEQIRQKTVSKQYMKSNLESKPSPPKITHNLATEAFHQSASSQEHTTKPEVTATQITNTEAQQQASNYQEPIEVQTASLPPQNTLKMELQAESSDTEEELLLKEIQMTLQRTTELKEISSTREELRSFNPHQTSNYIDEFKKIPNPNPNPLPLLCPRCQNVLVIRTAQKGKHSGQSFWGCSSFPKCWYKQAYHDLQTSING